MLVTTIGDLTTGFLGLFVARVVGKDDPRKYVDFKEASHICVQLNDFSRISPCTPVTICGCDGG